MSEVSKQWSTPHVCHVCGEPSVAISDGGWVCEEHEERFPLTEEELHTIMDWGVTGAELQALIQRGISAEEREALREAVAKRGR